MQSLIWSRRNKVQTSKTGRKIHQNVLYNPTLSRKSYMGDYAHRIQSSNCKVSARDILVTVNKVGVDDVSTAPLALSVEHIRSFKDTLETLRKNGICHIREFINCISKGGALSKNDTFNDALILELRKILLHESFSRIISDLDDLKNLISKHTSLIWPFVSSSHEKVTSLDVFRKMLQSLDDYYAHKETAQETALVFNSTNRDSNLTVINSMVQNIAKVKDSVWHPNAELNSQISNRMENLGMEVDDSMDFTYTAEEELAIHDRDSQMNKNNESQMEICSDDTSEDTSIEGQGFSPVSEIQNEQKALISMRLCHLNPEEEYLVDKMLSPPYDETLIIEKYNAPITRSKMSCLRPGTWVNDEIINFYMKMLQDRDAALCKIHRNRKPSFYFSSFFMERLLETDGQYKFENIKRYFKDSILNNSFLCS